MISWDVKWIPKKIPKGFHCSFPKKREWHFIDIEIPDEKENKI